MYIHITYTLYWKRCLSSTYQTNQTNPNPPQVRTPPRASTVNDPISEVKVWVLSRWTMVEVLWEISTGPSYHHIRWPLGVGESAGWKVLWDFIVWWRVLHIPRFGEQKSHDFSMSDLRFFSCKGLVKDDKEDQVVFWKARFGEAFGNAL